MIAHGLLLTQVGHLPLVAMLAMLAVVIALVRFSTIATSGAFS